MADLQLTVYGEKQEVSVMRSRDMVLRSCDIVIRSRDTVIDSREIRAIKGLADRFLLKFHHGVSRDLIIMTLSLTITQNPDLILSIGSDSIRYLINEQLTDSINSQIIES